MNLRVLSLLTLASVAVAAQAQYSFTPIDADSADGSRTLSGAPALNNAGQIAYRGNTDDGSALFRYSGGAVSTIADSSDGLGFIGFFPTINASGGVGFAANDSDSNSRVFRTSGAGVQEVGGAGFDFIDFFPTINASGSIAFQGERLPGFVDGVYVADDSGSVAAVYDETGPYDGFGSAPSLNDSGQVAFTAFRDSDGEQALLLGNGGALTEIVNTAGDLSFVNDLVDLNNAGDVAFLASRDDGSSALLRYRGGALETLVDTNDVFQDLSTLSMNDNGDVAFTGTLDDGTLGLFLGSERTTPLLSAGSTFLGKTLFGFGLSRQSLNDNGQLAFLAFFDDGSSSLVLANPVPEPASMAALTLGAFGLLRRRKRA